MTCVAGIKTNDRVIIGADSAGVSGLAVTIRSDEKVFKNGPCLFGFTTSFRMGQLLRYQLQVPEQKQSMTDVVFVHTELIEAIRKCLKDYGYACVDKNEEHGGTFLLGYRGELYRVDSDYQIGVSDEDFAACGCGQSYALGSLHETRELLPRERIERALQAAAHFSVGVRPPFHIVEIMK